MAERNAGIESDRRMRFRMGINLGDVICDESRVYGDGVNIAARLEGIAEPGGIFVSRQVYDQVRDKIALGFRELGPQTLKNIAKPIEVFAVDVDDIGRSHNAPTAAALKQEIHYCRAPDGVRLAWAKVGKRQHGAAYRTRTVIEARRGPRQQHPPSICSNGLPNAAAPSKACQPPPSWGPTRGFLSTGAPPGPAHRGFSVLTGR